jgi:hypothetical protein
MLIRKAVATDQAAIVRLVRAARINPIGLAWPRFLVGEEAGQVIGTVQVRIHRDGNHILVGTVRGLRMDGILFGSLLCEKGQPRVISPMA